MNSVEVVSKGIWEEVKMDFSLIPKGLDISIFNVCQPKLPVSLESYYELEGQLRDCLKSLKEKTEIIVSLETKINSVANCISSLSKGFENLFNSIQIQIEDPASKTDPYMRGMANGMLFAKSCFENVEPKYIDEPNIGLNEKRFG